ncbi:hypothetical protein [Gimesia sp.]|uniref:hypothetical protein n=1 Tax=Gimesia sp. TaxID=2024833 RepID=UPI003A8D9AF7
MMQQQDTQLVAKQMDKVLKRFREMEHRMNELDGIVGELEHLNGSFSDRRKATSSYRAMVDLIPFWIGTVALSHAAGFFIGQTQIEWIPAAIFAQAVVGLFIIAFSSFSTVRKNVFGLFLGLFSISFWIGAQILYSNWSN